MNIHLTLIVFRWKRIGKIIRDFSGSLLVTTRWNYLYIFKCNPFFLLRVSVGWLKLALE